MKRSNRMIILAVAALLALGAGGAGLYRLGARHAAHSGPSPVAQAPATEAGSRQPLYWHDPMVPGQKFDKPGKSPFMDMPLVPVYASPAGDEGKVGISPRMQQNLGVRTAQVTHGTLSGGLTAVGSVAFNERDLLLVQARSSGYIEKLHVRAPLDPVRKGQPLAELYVPDWVAAQEEYLTARRLQGRGVEGIAQAARQRMRLAGMEEAQMRRVESSGTVHPRVTLTAPASGIVTELAAREGMAVSPGATLFRINGLAIVWVNAEIPESAAQQVRPGEAVEARTTALPGTVFAGRVSAILPQVDAATRTLKARVELANPGGRLVPGMFATLSFAQAGGGHVLLVPTEAVIRTGTRSVVMLAQEEGRFAPVEVETGAESNGQTEIRKGLEAGQKVVVSGQFLVDSEASLKGTMGRMAGPAPVSPPAAPPASAPAAIGSPHSAQGRIEHIEDGEIMISHGPVPALRWGAMTMGFAPPPGGLPPAMRVGDTVSFDFVQNRDGGFMIVRITPAASPGAAR